MKKKLFLMTLICTKALLALGPAIECRFTALTKDGHINLDESIVYGLDPLAGITGSFDPYDIEISAFGNVLTVGIYVDGDPISGVQIPVENVFNLPPGGSVFGRSTAYHRPVHGFFSIAYECQKISL